MAQIVGRECNCEDFPCCGHGLTEADITERYTQEEMDIIDSEPDFDEE